MNRTTILCAALLFLGSLAAVAQQKTDAIILNIAGEDIPKSEFERVFKKNNTKDNNYDQKAVNDYLQLYINYKLKVREALELGMDTVKSFVDELAGYRKQLAQPYLVDKQVSEQLIREAYDRMKTDLRASHILIKCDQNALPKDTLEAYNKANRIRSEIMKGMDFTAAAKKYSEDPSVKDNGGDLGYFSAMQMVYPFESAAYNTKAGEVSSVIRTRFGYHIVKVTDSRPAQGEVHVAHIMVKLAAGAKEEDSLKATQKINEIAGKIKAGDKFEDLARQFSDDQSSSKAGGTLPWFGTGRMVPEFEKAAFALKNAGDVSDPVRTSYGWHIIKMLERKPLASYEEMQNDLKGRVQKDSRSELSKSSMINRVKSKYAFRENPKTRDEFNKVVDSTLTQGKWTADRASALKSVMFSLGNKSYTQQDFAAYVADHQSKRGGTIAPQVMVSNLYNEWVNESVLAYEESKLDSLYPDFRNLMQEYRDGILLFELTDKKVWSKAVKDTAGLKSFYEANKAKYPWPDRLDATIYTCADADIAKQVHKLMKTVDDVDTLMSRINKTSQLNLQVKTGKFAKGDNDVIDKVEWKKGMSKDMPHNNQVVFVDVHNVLPAGPKSLDEAKGLVTADYQSSLEKEWIEQLRSKYAVKINQDVVDSVANK